MTDQPDQFTPEPVTPESLRARAAEWEAKARETSDDDAAAKMLRVAEGLRARADREALLSPSPALTWVNGEVFLTAEYLRAQEYAPYREEATLKALDRWQSRADDLAASAAKRQRQGKAPLVSETKALAKARAEAYALSELIDDHRPVHKLTALERFPLS